MPAISPKRWLTTFKNKLPEEAVEKRPPAVLFMFRHASIAWRASAARETAIPIMSMPESRSEYFR